MERRERGQESEKAMNITRKEGEGEAKKKKKVQSGGLKVRPKLFA